MIEWTWTETPPWPPPVGEAPIEAASDANAWGSQSRAEVVRWTKEEGYQNLPILL